MAAKYEISTLYSALLASGSLLNVVDAVCNEEVTRGVAIIRPPGHHAEADEACGFCLFNNVALAGLYNVCLTPVFVRSGVERNSLRIFWSGTNTA